MDEPKKVDIVTPPVDEQTELRSSMGVNSDTNIASSIKINSASRTMSQNQSRGSKRGKETLQVRQFRDRLTKFMQTAKGAVQKTAAQEKLLH